MKSWIRPAAVAGAAVAIVLATVALPGTAGGKVPAPATAGPASAAQQRLPSVITTANELGFVPITPCRIIDTRAGSGTNSTPFTAGQVRTYYVGGTFGFAPQGGTSGGCGIPVGASALAAVLTVAAPSGAGYLQSWRNGEAQPTTSVLNYTNQTTIASGSTLPINDSTAYSLKIRNSGGITHVVVDVTGYYIKPIIALVRSTGTTYDGTSRTVDSGRLAVGQYWVEFDRDITYCTAQVTSYNLSAYARADTFADPSDQRVRVYLYNSGGTAVDGWFYIRVSC